MINSCTDSCNALVCGACSCNDFDNVRQVNKRNGKKLVVVRCRVCQSMVHMSSEVFRGMKCSHFAAEGWCPEGYACDKLHVNGRKESLKTRMKKHGEKVLHHVPVCVRQQVQQDQQQQQRQLYEASSSSSSVGHRDSGCESQDVRGRDPLPARNPKRRQRPPQATNQRPCMHNKFDNVRAKKGISVLRCRECQKQWRLRMEDVKRCPVFNKYPGCTDPACPLLHVYRKKEPLWVRFRKHGSAVLERVPSTDLMSCHSGLNIPIEVQTEPPESPRNDVPMRASSCPPGPHDHVSLHKVQTPRN